MKDLKDQLTKAVDQRCDGEFVKIAAVIPDFDKVIKRGMKVFFYKKQHLMMTMDIMIYNNLLEEAEKGVRYRGVN